MTDLKKSTMKKFITTAIIILGFFLTSNPLISQPPPPPPGGHGDDGNQNAGNGAPIGGGLFILLGLGAAYGGKKVYDWRGEMKDKK
jgi:hypothetical protein